MAAFGILLAVIGAIWLLALAFQGSLRQIEVVQADRVEPLLPVETPSPPTNAIAAPTSRPNPTSAAVESSVSPVVTEIAPLTPRLLLDSDLGTGSQEFSAVALNEDLNRLLIADDSGLLYEFDLDATGLPVTPLRRTIVVAVGGGDVEALSWISGQSYVIGHEDDGTLTVVEIDDETTRITTEHLRRTVDTSIREVNGNGLEGVSLVPGDSAIEFVVVDERPPQILALGPDEAVVFSSTEAFDMTDFSDIYVDVGGTYSVLSDEARLIVDFTIDASGTTVVVGRTELDTRAGRFEQPEGLVRSRDGSRLYVVGEEPGPGNFAFGFWSNA